MEQADFLEQLSVEINALRCRPVISLVIEPMELCRLGQLVQHALALADERPARQEAATLLLGAVAVTVLRSEPVTICMPAFDAWVLAGLIQDGYDQPGVMRSSVDAGARFLEFVSREVCKPGTVLEQAFKLRSKALVTAMCEAA